MKNHSKSYFENFKICFFAKLFQRDLKLKSPHMFIMIIESSPGG